MLKHIWQQLNALSHSDQILLITFFAILWYTWETHQLRKEQRKAVYLTLIDLEMKRRADPNLPPLGDWPNNLRRIVELGKFDPRLLYAGAFQEPITLRGKMWKWFKAKVSK